MKKLIGSEKQIAWAEKIRESLLEQLQKYSQENDGKYTYRRKEYDIQAHITYMAEEIEKATWFIDNRNYEARDVLTSIRDEMEGWNDETVKEYCLKSNEEIRKEAWEKARKKEEEKK